LFNVCSTFYVHAQSPDLYITETYWPLTHSHSHSHLTHTHTLKKKGFWELDWEVVKMIGLEKYCVDQMADCDGIQNLLLCAYWSSFCLKYFLFCHLGQRGLNAEKKNFEAKLDKDAQYCASWSSFCLKYFLLCYLGQNVGLNAEEKNFRGKTW